jgi:peptidoglycan hydrolase-like protein with peptidoglycan-binding domain
VLHRFRSDVRLALALMIVAAAAIVPATAQASSPRLGTRMLRQGMTGPDVKTLQTELTKVGLKTDETGYFGPMTEGNVRKFESSHRLRVNGLVTQQFVRQLGSAIAAHTTIVMPAEGNGAAALTIRQQTTKTDPTDNPVTIAPNGSSKHLGDRTLRKGMTGHDVRVLQGYLTLAGFATNVDGDFGPTTEANVIAFQLAHGMVGNGIFTYAESLVLRQAVATTLATAPVGKARINPDGTATAPAGAPQVVQEVIAAANQIIDKPYIYAGGHASWNAPGYDCSGSVSYALHGGGLLSSSEDSTGLESYGSPGPGKWITIYADAAHTWIVVAGIAFDTADYGGPNIPSGTGPRWRSNPTGNLADGGDYIVRHPSGL